jgi:subtilisin
MKRYASLALIPVLLALAACGGSGSTLPGNVNNTASAAQAAAGRYVVGFAPGISTTQMQAVTGGLLNRPDHSYTSAFNGFAGPLTAAEHSALASDPNIAFIEPDITFTAFPGNGGGGNHGGGGGGSSPPPQEIPWGISRIDATSNAGGGDGVVVAVIDTGIDLDHPDLAGNVVIPDEDTNFVRPGNLPDDDNGHGTHCSGIICAVDNDFGVVGVAPKAKVLPVKVLDRRGSGWLSDVISGVQWVGDFASKYGIKVANMSLGASGSSSGLAAAITYSTGKGVTFVVAAGNSFADANNYIPAGYSNVITVSAMDSSDDFAYFSNWGTAIDVIAPGVSVDSLYKNGGYATLSGTSMASPHAAGAAALWLDNHPTDTFTQVRAALITTPPDDPGPWPGDPDNIDEPLPIVTNY